MTSFDESTAEVASLSWLGELGYVILSGPEIAPGELQAERDKYEQVVLERRLREVLQRLNPEVPPEAIGHNA